MGEKCAQTQTPVITVVISHHASPEKTSYDVHTLSGRTTRRSSVNNNNLEAAKRKKRRSAVINGMLCMNLFILCELAVDLAVCVCVCVRSDVTLKNKYDCSSELKT